MGHDKSVDTIEFEGMSCVWCLCAVVVFVVVVVVQGYMCVSAM